MNAELPKGAGSALIWRTVQFLGGRVVSLTRTLILAQLLVPEDFGLMAIAAVSVELFLSLSDFGMVPALIQGSESNRARYDAAWSVRLIRALMVSLALLLLAPLLAAAFGDVSAIPLIRILALRPLIEATASIMTADLRRNLRFRPLAIIGLSSALTEAVSAILLVSVLGVVALAVGALIGSAIGAMVSYLLAPYRPRFSFSRRAVAPLFRFGRWIFLSGVVGVIGGVVLQAAISRQLGADQLGVYYLAAALAFLPNDVASSILTRVTFPLHARLQSDLHRIGLVFRMSLSAELSLLAPIYMVLIAVAPSLVDQVLGDRWAGTTAIIRILAVAALIGVFADGAMPMLKGVGRPDRVTVLFAIRSVTVVALIPPLVGRFDLVGAALAWLAAELVVQVVASLFVLQALPRPFEGFWARGASIMIASVTGGAAAFVVNWLTGSLLGLTAAIATGLLLAAAMLWLLDSLLGHGLWADFVRVFPARGRATKFPNPSSSGPR